MCHPTSLCFVLFNVCTETINILNQLCSPQRFLFGNNLLLGRATRSPYCMRFDWQQEEKDFYQTREVTEQTRSKAHLPFSPKAHLPFPIKSAGDYDQTDISFSALLYKVPPPLTSLLMCSSFRNRIQPSLHKSHRKGV